MDRLISWVGMLALLGVAWLLSNDRKAVSLRLVLAGMALQFLFAVAILWTTPGKVLFSWARELITRVLASSDAGAEVVFGETFKEHFFAFAVLPAIIFVASTMAILFHLGILQKVIAGMAKAMAKVMNVSGSESLCAAANVFAGHTEAPLAIRPYLATMTRSEIMAMMTGGMATVSGGTLAAYAGLGVDPGHLLTASVISAPASLVVAKIMIPETQESPTKGEVKIVVPKQDANLLDAACRGASEGVRLAINVAAMLIAFLALVALVNEGFKIFPEVAGEPLTLEKVLGWAFAPVAWIIGVEWKDARAVGMLLGKKTILNEFVAFIDLAELKDQISERSYILSVYALCGFANFGSIAVQIGGIGSLVPERRKDFAQLGFRAMIAGTIATLLTATVVGMLI